MWPTVTQRVRALALQTVGWLIVAGSVAYAYHRTGEASWFALLIIGTAVIAALSGAKVGIGFAVVGVATAVFLTLRRAVDPSTTELIMVSGIWVLLSVLVGVLGDVSRSRAALSRELKAQRDWFWRLIEVMPDSVVHADFDGTVLFCSEDFASLVGRRSADEVVGRSGFESLEPDEQEKLRRNITRALSETIVVDDYRLYQNGSVKEIEVSTRTLSESDSDLAGFIAVCRDVTEERRKARQVASLLRDKERLLAEVQHRIKNHMAFVSSFINLQRLEYANPEVSAALQETQNRIDVMHALYQALYLQPESSRVALRPMIGNIVDTLQNSIVNTTAISIETVVPEIELPSRNLLMVGIVVNELVTNSLKYAAEPTQTPLIVRVEITARDNTVRIVVRDTGVGFPAAIIDGSRRGFGLSLVESYVNETEGSLSLTNVDDGAEAVVMLPLNR